MLGAAERFTVLSLYASVTTFSQLLKTTEFGSIVCSYVQDIGAKFVSIVLKLIASKLLIFLVFGRLDILPRKLLHLFTFLDKKIGIFSFRVIFHYLLGRFRYCPSILLHCDHTTLAEWPDVLFYVSFYLHPTWSNHSLVKESFTRHPHPHARWSKDMRKKALFAKRYSLCI